MVVPVGRRLSLLGCTLLVAVFVAGCQQGAAPAQGAPPAAGAVPRGGAEAYDHDIERICNVMTLSGADKEPGAAPLTTARWLAANIETGQARTFMIALNDGPPLVKAGVLDAEATKAKLPICPLAALWRAARE